MEIIKQAKIWDVDLTDEFPGHNMIFLELITESNKVGLGEIALAYGVGAKAALELMAEIVKKFVLNRSPFDSQAIWNDIEKKTYWAEGRNLMHRGVQSAVDIALWDLKGQILNQPVYNLLGGKVRDNVPLYANHWYGELHTPKDYAMAAKKVVADGYKGLKFDPFRMSPKGEFSIPPRPLPKEWGELALERVAAVRNSIGSDMYIFIDAHATLGVNDAIKWGKRLEAYDIFFFEEPVISFLPEETMLVKNKMNAQIAGGERLYCKQDFYPFISQNAYDLIQPDICLAGGFTGMKEIATLAATKDIYVQPHNCAGPICSAASVHFSMATTNILIQEWFPYWEDNRYQYVNGAYENFTKNGTVAAPEKPGLTISLAYEKMQRFKCKNIT